MKPADECPIDCLLGDFSAMTSAEKIKRVQERVAAGRHDPSGILVSMPKTAMDGLRRVRDEDFKGMDRFSDNFGLRFRSICDFFDNENSITTSGSHLAAQSIRYAATGDAAALAEARVAYRSLRLIFEMGSAAGCRGFLGKPYHFEFSTHTTGDQYLHALWGWWSFFPVASGEEQAEIREIIKAVADALLASDFTFHFSDGRTWNNRTDPSDYNAIMAAWMGAAFHLLGDAKYEEACRTVMESGRWMTVRRLDSIIEEIQTGSREGRPWDQFGEAHRRPDEFVHWEQVQHCQFVAISAVVLHESVPHLMNAGQLEKVLALWWRDQPVGFDPEYWNYFYWFFVSAEDRSWRRAPLTPRFRREQWFGGHPMISYMGAWQYSDCLARFLWTAMAVARYCPARREEGISFARQTFQRLEPRHLLWISDPIGGQIPPELRYFKEFLSSETPENLIAAYWEGVRLGCWHPDGP